jgi:hypothetical protein
MYARSPAGRARGLGERVFGYSSVTYRVVTYSSVTYSWVTYPLVSEQVYARNLRATNAIRTAAAWYGRNPTNAIRTPHRRTSAARLTRLQPRGRMAAYWRGRARGLAHNDPIRPH